VEITLVNFAIMTRSAKENTIGKVIPIHQYRC